MAEIVGKNARVKCSTNIITGIKSWTIDYTADTAEITNFDDSGIKKFLATLTGWTGSFEGYGQPGWSTYANVGNTYLGSFFVSAADGDCYSGSVIITGASPSQAVDGVGAISYSFQGTGALGFGG